MAPAAVTPAKYGSMSDTVTCSLATATTSRWGWQIVEWTGMARRLALGPGGGHAAYRKNCLRAATIASLQRSNLATPGGPDEQSRRDHPRQASGPPVGRRCRCAQLGRGSDERPGDRPRVGVERGAAAARDRRPDWRPYA